MTEEVQLRPPKRGRVALFIAVPIAVVIGLLVLVLATSQPATDRLAKSPLVGKVAPAIAGTTTDGKTFDLTTLHGRWVLVNFFATWCVPCRQEQPELTSFSSEHASTGDATVISVAFGDTATNVENFFNDNHANWPVIAVDQGRIALDYGVSGVPESFLVDPDGVVRAKVTGGVTSRGLDGILAKLEGSG